LSKALTEGEPQLQKNAGVRGESWFVATLLEQLIAEFGSGFIRRSEASIQISKFDAIDSCWPPELSIRLRDKAPSRLWAIGALEILGAHKVGLFCSVRCPGDAILGAYDSDRKLRDDGVTVVSGFHSPVEKECLRILLRGKQPIIICLARAFGKIRLPSDWRRALESGRLLLLSPFEKRPPRPDKSSTAYRNELVAALSDEVFIVHATPGGEIERISQLIERWDIPGRKWG
jgi:predicted Rossmann fold nucleotide-binding protein DprA/Smf involved in DNA uptake